MDTVNNVIDSRLSTSLGQYFNGVSLRAAVGDCAILTGVRKQNGAPVDIYTPSFALSQNDDITKDIGAAFAAYEKLSSARLQASERLLSTRSFKKSPALAVLSCPEPVFNDAFDTRPLEMKLAAFDEILEGLAHLHSAGLLHGNLSDQTIRREGPDSTLRLCDLTFSGGRATTVTTQPAIYQSRNVINTAQPAAVDDVHAAGMIGYRIFMGENGPSRMLGGTDDTASITAAILAEQADAPTAEQLFPDGHPSAEQIARLLARMTGRLANTAPYSTAEAARRAFRTVLDSPGVATAAAMSPPPALHPQPHIMAAQTQQPAPAGVSRATALMLFAGFLVSTGGAVFASLENARTSSTLQAAMHKLNVTQTAAAEQAETATRQIESLQLLRASDVLLTQATYSGAGIAGEESAAALATGLEALARADLAHDSGIFAGVAESGDIAKSAALAALETLEHARATANLAAETLQEVTTAMQVAAHPDDPSLVAALDLIAQAKADLSEGRFAIATQAFSNAQTMFADLNDLLRTKADATQSSAQQALATAPENAASILARTYFTRAEATLTAGALADATVLFQAVIDTVGTPIAAAASPAVMPQTGREITFGDTPADLAQAVALCRTDAPIAAENCPASRPAGEAQRRATLQPYRLDATEVSAAAFAAFVAETNYVSVAETEGTVVALTSSGEARLITGAYTWAAPGGAGTSHMQAPDNPVTNIALDDAVAYCAWAGGRLPTEAEWETAGRGATAQPFPWGTWRADAAVWRGAPTSGMRTPQAVDRAAGASAQGHVGMSGNAREWVLGADGPVLKGGSWNTANPADLRLSARLTVPGNAPGVDFGFRCAMDAEVWP